VFVAAFLLLLGAAAAVGMAQFWSGNMAPWLSIGYSAGAIVLTFVALLMRPPRG
jgi:hypothetical protein